MPMRNSSRLLSAMLKMLSKSDAETVADIEDALDVKTESDQFNVADHGNKPRTPTGPAEAMSGQGAEKFISDYATDHTQDQGLVQAYAGLAQALADQNKRVAGVEKSLSAIARFIAQSVGKSDAAETFGAGVDDDEDEDDEEDKNESDDRKESSAKSGMRTLSIPQLMRELSGYSRSGVKGLATPPTFIKAASGPSTREKLSDAIDTLIGSDHLQAVTLCSRMHLAQNNEEARQAFVNSLAKSSFPVQQAFAKAGIVSTSTVAKADVKFGG